MPCACAFVFALTSTVTLATLASCRGSMKGDLHATVNGRPVDCRSAYALSHGGRSFRLYASNHRRGVDWALREGVGVIESGEMSVGADVAPVFRDDGVLEWKIVGLWWIGDSRAGWPVGTLAFDTRPVDVSSGPGCGHHLRVHLSNVGRDAGAGRPKEDEVTLDGDFDAACAQALAPTTSPPMLLHVGAESFPSRAQERLRTRTLEGRQCAPRSPASCFRRSGGRRRERFPQRRALRTVRAFA
jgi:hypothetical protein